MQALLNTHDIVCIQEHWLYSFETHILNTLASPTHEAFTKCVDDNDPISPLQRPRGMRGVAVLWHRRLSHLVTVHPDGSDRVCVITIKTTSDRDLCVVTVYMPSRGLSDSEREFQAMLTELEEILLKFQVSHHIILAGDWNASLLLNRDCHRDSVFKTFCSTHGLETDADMGDQPTYERGIHKSQNRLCPLHGLWSAAQPGRVERGAY